MRGTTAPLAASKFVKVLTMLVFSCSIQWSLGHNDEFSLPSSSTTLSCTRTADIGTDGTCADDAQAIEGSSVCCPSTATSTATAATITSEEHVTTNNNKRHHRGTVLSNPLDVDEMYRIYHEIQSNYRNKTMASALDWKILNEKDGVEVSLMEHENDPTCPYVRMRAVIPVPVQQCWDFLRVANWDETMPLMDPYYEGVSVHGNFSSRPGQRWHQHDYSNDTSSSPPLSAVNMLLCRKRMKRIFAFGKRDLVFLSVTENEPLPDGTWVSGTVSVHTQNIPRQDGYTRAFQDSVAFYKPIDQNHTALTIVCRIDLNDSSTASGKGGGWIPMWLYVKTIGYTGAESVLRMRKALVDVSLS